uniref:Uncharacterized protein n=1 Tax=viral metagenome TaxID=1070528 RepID=A0A6C0JQ98_9ZZZZ
MLVLRRWLHECDFDCGEREIIFPFDGKEYRLSGKCIFRKDSIMCNLAMWDNEPQVKSWSGTGEYAYYFIDVDFSRMMSELQDLVDNFNFGLDSRIYNENIL